MPNINLSLLQDNRKNILLWHIITILLIAACILVSYSNTFHNSFHFDDERNITNNEYLKIDSFSLSSLNTLFVKSMNSRRFIANFSFALDYYFYRHNVFGYHVVNTVIHILSGVVLYLFIYLTFSRTSLRSKYGQYAHIIASCTALIFAVHPVQTQSVTYIVQRMCSMATLFYLSSMLFYVNGKLSEGRRKLTFFILSLTSALFAFATKENTIVLPIMILLYELYFFQNFNLFKARKKLFFALLLIIIPLTVLFIIFGPQHFKSALDFSNKDFTMAERLLTQPRVVLYYLTLLLFPLPSRLNLDYDFPLSYSLFDPVTTIVSIVVIAGLIIFSVVRARKHPLFSYFTLWYFINLLIESSIFPLEMVYEHRLYLPSIGFFVLAVVLSIKVYEHFKKRMKADSSSPELTWISLFTVLVLLLSTGTYQRNFVWTNLYTMWSDITKKSPNKARAHSNLGTAHLRNKEYLKAIPLFKKAVSLNHDYSYAYYNLGIIYQTLGQFDESIDQYNKALHTTKQFYFYRIHNNLGVCYILTEQLDRAIAAFKESIKLKTDFADPYYNLALAYKRKGLYSQSAELKKKAKAVEMGILN